MAEQKVQIFTDINKLETLSSDLVNIEVNNGYVILNFLQTFPSTPMPIPNAPQVDRSAKIISRISLSWEHFTNLIPYFIKVAKDNENLSQVEYNKAIDFLKKISITEDNTNGR